MSASLEDVFLAAVGQQVAARTRNNFALVLPAFKDTRKAAAELPMRHTRLAVSAAIVYNFCEPQTRITRSL